MTEDADRPAEDVSPSHYEPLEDDQQETATRGTPFGRGQPRPMPGQRPAHARGGSADSTDAAELTQRIEQEQREAERVQAERLEAEQLESPATAAGRSAPSRSEVLAGEEVPVDLVDAEHFDARASQNRVPGAAARPSPAASASATPPSGPRPAHRPSPFASPMPEPEPVPEAAATAPEGREASGPEQKTLVEPRDGDGHRLDESNVPAEPVRRRPGYLRRHARGIIRTVIALAIAAVVAVLLRVYVIQPYYIPSASMEPTLHGCPGCTDDRVIVDKLSYRFQDVHSGDIVVFDKPPKAVGIDDNVLIKRVVAVGGDTLALKNDRIYINGLPVDETYLNDKFLAKNCSGRVARPETGTTKWKIPADDVFVMGDNRCNSDDSRTFGPIPKDSIIGRARLIIWPLDRIGGL